MELYVAKSYQGLPVVEEPYKKSGKTYCKVRTPKGVLIKFLRTKSVNYLNIIFIK